MEKRTLHQALADKGLTSIAGAIEGKRTILKGGVRVGDFDAAEGWKLIESLELRKLTRVDGCG